MLNLSIHNRKYDNGSKYYYGLHLLSLDAIAVVPQNLETENYQTLLQSILCRDGDLSRLCIGNITIQE
ncbi:MAG: hypothetical protein RMX96_18540 [Nostoc sp. ChiSLP02]|nr:hypothetical protein [Nostoc sp. DedSLP05]MDZ8099837.1 hypothetical protein [Nostoc sp. DedSLP01]MDZ8186835.1 hypothetical protein [Nostoc sp. ChiSLP02]